MSLVFGHWLWALGYDPTLPSLDRQTSASTSQTEEISTSTASITIEPPEPIPDIPSRSSKRPCSYCSEDATPSNVEPPSPQIAQPPSPVSSLTDTLCENMEPLTLSPVPDVTHSPEEKVTASHVEVAVVPPPSPRVIEATGTKRRFSLSAPSRTSSPADARLGTATSSPSLKPPSIQEGDSEREVVATSAVTDEAVAVTTTPMATTIASSTDAQETPAAGMTTVSAQEPEISPPPELIPDLASELPTPSAPPTSDSTAEANPLDAVKIPQPQQTFTMRQVAQHNSPQDLWLVIGDEVFDCTEFAATHPGGAKILNSVAGKDATKKFDKHHRRAILERYKPKLQVGVLDNDPAGASGSGSSINARRGFLGKIGFGGKGRPKGPYGFARRGTM